MARLLFIDDSRADLLLFRIVCEQFGYSYEGVASFLELEALMSNSMEFDIVFIDIFLPYYNGYAIFNYLKQHSSCHHAKFIVLSAHNTEYQRAKDIGFDGFLLKPIVLSYFKLAIIRILNGEEVW